MANLSQIAIGQRVYWRPADAQGRRADWRREAKITGIEVNARGALIAIAFTHFSGQEREFGRVPVEELDVLGDEQ